MMQVYVELSSTLGLPYGYTPNNRSLPFMVFPSGPCCPPARRALLSLFNPWTSRCVQPRKVWALCIATWKWRIGSLKSKEVRKKTCVCVCVCVSFNMCTTVDMFCVFIYIYIIYIYTQTLHVWYIYIHGGWEVSGVNVGKYCIHGVVWMYRSMHPHIHPYIYCIYIYCTAVQCITQSYRHTYSV